MPRARHWMLASLAASLTGGATLSAQAAAAPTALNFSGIIFGSYNFQQSTTPNQLNRQIDNAFIVDRAYLTFKMPAGDHTSIRITTDLYQTSEANPNAYTIRAKYAYLQYDASKMDNGLQVTGRIGILHNVVIDHEENFWPRYLSQVALERAGYFASADVGVATQVALPNKMGELYATVTNGPGYTSREVDRFKDYAARLSLTPLANSKDMPLLSTFTITAWGYKGATASSFVNGGAGTNGAVGSALDRSRAGLFVGIKDPRLVIAGEWARRHEGGETGDNTVASPVSATETTGQLLSAYTVIRPLAFANESGKSPFGVVARYDHVKPTSSTTGFATAPSTDNAYHTVVAGLFWDLSQKAQLALDYQESLASSNALSNAPPAPAKAYFAHFVVNF
ncbi:MAG: hypothetical protein M3Z05_05340 [Gemmatimonadota bacterium]|nr:hypothetical protein [Gemmatimonadota bacterium]